MFIPNQLLTMKNFKIMLVALLAVFGVQATMAQELTKQYPYAFVGVQGGGQFVANGYKIKDVAGPAASAYVGAMWTPVLGTRLHLNGWEAKEGVKDLNMDYKFKYATATVDLMVNLVSAVNHRDDNALDVYFIGGIGANKVWGNNWPEQELKSRVHNHIAHACKVGAMADWNLSSNVSLNLEVDAVHHGNHDYAHEVNMSKDWQIIGQIGLKVNLFKTKKPAPAPAPAPVPVVVEEPAPAPAPVVKKEEPKPAPVVVKEEPLKETFFYTIRESDPDPETILSKIVAWCNKYPAKNITISGYADAGTGNAKINKMYAEQRATKVADALRAKGIATDRMSVKSYGDTVQPYAENDRNRCVIVVGE